ncbi:MAG: hypothetical protein JW862_04235 [Anaerolineales bacterium]|nr:hypothetical protein [Anaerolineales bacterium]
MSTVSSTIISPSKSILAGAVAGLGGGLIFGMLMGMMGMLPMVGMLIRVQNAFVGFLVHMLISAVIGAIYGFVAGRLPATLGTAVIAGGINGSVWWVLGALLLMPLSLGMNQMIFVIGTDQWMSLIGHLLYGIITGILFLPLSKRL